jgi:hypothetical protein
MKTLIAAVIASAVSFGAFAQSGPATGAAAPMADKPAKAASADTTKKAATKKAPKKHAAKKSTKKAMRAA